MVAPRRGVGIDHRRLSAACPNDSEGASVAKVKNAGPFERIITVAVSDEAIEAAKPARSS
jgi:hypothetical protein